MSFNIWSIVKDPREENSMLDNLKEIKLDCGITVQGAIDQILFGEESEVSELKLRRSLNDLGLVLTRGGYLFVSDKSSALSKHIGQKLLWNQELKKIDGVKRSKYPKRFGDVSKRGLLIPVKQLLNTSNT